MNTTMGTLYRNIKDDLFAKISDGTYSEGDLIPSETDLAKQYGVSRPTMRQALKILVDEGYLERRRRRGTIVTKPTSPDADPKKPGGYQADSGLQSFEEELRRAGHSVRTMPILAKIEEASEGIARALELAAGDPVIKLVRLRYVDEIPHVFMEHYLPSELYPGFLNADFSQVGLYQRMNDLGRPVRTITRRLEVMKADASSATLLDLPIGDPLFHFQTFGRAQDNRMVEYSISTYRGRNNSFEFTVGAEEPSALVLPSDMIDPIDPAAAEQS